MSHAERVASYEHVHTASQHRSTAHHRTTLRNGVALAPEQHQHAGRTQYNARFKKSCQLTLYCEQQQTPPIAASTKKRMLLSSGLSEARTTPRGVGAGRDGFPAPLLHNRRRENTHTQARRRLGAPRRPGRKQLTARSNRTRFQRHTE